MSSIWSLMGSESKISVSKALIQLFNSLEIATYLSELANADSDEEYEDNYNGWFCMTEKMMYDKIRLKRVTQENARKFLTEKGILKTRVFGMPPKTHFKINYDVLEEQLTYFLETEYKPTFSKAFERAYGSQK